MAKFEIAESITGRNEGGYANNPADTGGETYAGIARNYWPNWQGWKIIDNIKFDLRVNGVVTATNINKAAKANAFLTNLISQFYKQNFWDVNKLDQIKDQQLANTVYDFGVNSGTGRAAKFLQDTYNEWKGIRVLSVDGMIGPMTLEYINASKHPELIYGLYNKKREAFYRSIAKGSQVQFLKSWLSRLKPYKNV